MWNEFAGFCRAIYESFAWSLIFAVGCFTFCVFFIARGDLLWATIAGVTCVGYLHAAYAAIRRGSEEDAFEKTMTEDQRRRLSEAGQNLQRVINEVEREMQKETDKKKEIEIKSDKLN